MKQRNRQYKIKPSTGWLQLLLMPVEWIAMISLNHITSVVAYDLAKPMLAAGILSSDLMLI
jgi:hypothetical protein